MGIGYLLINETKKEKISFGHLNGNKKREIAGNAAQSAIVAWYLLSNQGDQIQFISDTYDDWPFQSGSKEAAFSYPDRTDELIHQLIAQEILKDNGFRYLDADAPNEIFTRDIVNVWCKSI